MPRGRGSRAPRGRDRSQFSRAPGGDDVQGVYTANINERFGRGAGFKDRQQSQQPSQPLQKPNVDIQRYFSKRQVGAGAPRWTTRPEVPQPEELLPYPVLPTQSWIPEDANSFGWSGQEQTGWDDSNQEAAGDWSNQAQTGWDDSNQEAAGDWSNQVQTGWDDSNQEAAGDWSNQPQTDWRDSNQEPVGDWAGGASEQNGDAHADAWALKSNATDAWSTQPVSGDNWQEDSNADPKTSQEAGDGGRDDAGVQSNPDDPADALKDNQEDQSEKPSSPDAEVSKHDESGQEPPVVIDTTELKPDDALDTSSTKTEKDKCAEESPAEGGLQAADNMTEGNELDEDTNANHGNESSAQDGWQEQPARNVWGDTPAWGEAEPDNGGSGEDHWNAFAPGAKTPQQNDDDAFESFENVTNIIDGPWPSKMDYLRSHYLLLREDALRPLRLALEHVRSMSDLNEDPAKATIGIYDQVQVCGLTFARRGLGVRVKFSLGRVGKNIHWAQSKRLITGSLVILMSPDKSRCKVATVASRTQALINKNPPEVDLFFGRPEDLDIDCSQDWIMIEERGGFFEAQRHTLVALQRMVTEEFPLQEHLINLETSIPPPAYIQENPVRDLRPISSREQNQQLLRQVDVLQEWPSNIHPNLDESQMNALNTILTKRLSIVQGPPGTGKTYVSVEALKVMLRNMVTGDPPIIITCQTNHALDQLLEHVSKFEPQYVRVGARSSNEEIKKRTLYELKSDRKPPRYAGIGKWKKLEGEMAKLINPLIKAEAGPESRDTFDLDVLRELGVLSNEQCDSIIKGAQEWVSHEEDADDRPLLKWIGKQLEPVKQRHQPVLMGYEQIDEGNIGFEEVMENEAKQVVREEDDMYEGLGGEFWAIGDTWTGRAIDNKQSRDQARELLKTKTDLWKIRASDRGNVYRQIQRDAKVKITERLRVLFPQYEKACEDWKVHRYEHEQMILKENKVVGLTTTGVSKYRGLIASLKPKIVLIEEAAETLEAPVIAACMESVQHLVLVGDHKQLRPNTHVQELQKPPYNLNISLFERLVNNQVSYSILQKQRRMKPEIRRMLKPIYGTKIKDNKSVQKLKNRPPVPGMGGLTSWFFTHEHPDERDQEFSCFNQLEAEMILGLVQYLHYNGLEAAKITILTFYNGQRRLVRRLFNEDEKARGNDDLKNVKLVTVDSYQGEENDVVILSLVRSNTNNSIGFIGVDNRVCVALSRAQRGFYILGNAQMLAGESWLWSQVITSLANGYVATPNKNEEVLTGPDANPGLPTDRRIGYTFPLWCKRHQRQFWIQDPHDWSRNVGGCDRKCAGRLQCGHVCPELCHPWSHSFYQCKEPCAKPLSCGHRCKLDCYQDPCECAQGCNQNGSAALTQSALQRLPQTTGTTDIRLQELTQDAATDDTDDTAAAIARVQQQERKQLDEENALLLFKDDASRDGMEAKLVEYHEAPDGSVQRKWEMSFKTPPGQKKKAAAEQQFFSLLDQ